MAAVRTNRTDWPSRPGGPVSTSPPALAADALVRLACGVAHPAGRRAPWRRNGPAADRGASTRARGPETAGYGEAGARAGPPAMVHVRVDHGALVRGHLEPGEICEIPGIGPIPVEVARRLAVDSILSVLVTDGVDVTTVAHAGRTIPASLQRALIERDPVCVVPGCDVREGLEIDHVEPFGQGGETSLANLVRLCHWHHYLKTHQGHRLDAHRRTAGGGIPPDTTRRRPALDRSG